MFLLDKVVSGTQYSCGTFSNFAFDGIIPSVTSLIVSLIQIGVPVLLIVFGMLDLGKAVMAQKEDEIKKGQGLFIKRLIAAVLVFLVVFISKTVIGLVAPDKDGNVTNCVNCFITGEASNTSCIQK